VGLASYRILNADVVAVAAGAVHERRQPEGVHRRQEVS
jgi:hypothetical protein